MKKNDSTDSTCYAVLMGREPGIYYTWEEVLQVTKGFLGASVKKCSSLAEAQELLGGKRRKYFRLAEEKQTEKLSNLHMTSIYTDGGFNYHTSDYSYAFVAVRNEAIAHTQSGLGANKEAGISLKNVAGELKAVMEAVKYVAMSGGRSMLIYHDFNGVRKLVTGEHKPKNPFSKQYKMFMEKWIEHYGLRVDFTKVKAHNGNRYNEMADQLAKEALLRTDGRALIGVEDVAYIAKLRRKAIKIKKTIDCFSGKGKSRQKLLSCGENVFLSYRHMYLNYDAVKSDLGNFVVKFIEKAKTKGLTLSQEQAYLFFIVNGLKMEKRYQKILIKKKAKVNVARNRHDSQYIKKLKGEAVSIKSPVYCFTVDDKDRQRLVSYGISVFNHKRYKYNSLGSLMQNIDLLVKLMLKKANEKNIDVTEKQCYLFFLNYSEKMEVRYQKKISR